MDDCRGRVGSHVRGPLVNLTVPKADLSRALKRACSVADKKTTMPVLACVQIVADKGGLEVRASCLDIWVRERIAADVEAAGTVAVLAKDLASRVDAMPEGPVVLKLDKDHMLVRAPGTSRRFSLATMPADDYPPMAEPSGEATPIDAETVRSLFGRASHAISHDESRAYLASLLVERDGKVLRAVATDGHRLAKIETPLKGKSAPPMLIPGRAVREVLKLAGGDDPVNLVSEAPNAFFTVGAVTLGVRLVEATFPPYEQVIPHASLNVATVDRQAITDAIRAVSLASNERTGGVRLRFAAGNVRVEAQSETGEGHDEVAAELSGGPMAICVNAGFLLDALEAHEGDAVGLGFSGEIDPLVMRGDGITLVCMPMRDL